MKIKEEAIIADSVRYCVDIEHDGKIFYASTTYWLHAFDSADWIIDSDDCDFDGSFYCLYMVVFFPQLHIIAVVCANY